MPQLRLSQLAAVAFLIAALINPVFAQYYEYVTGSNGLTKLETVIQTSKNLGNHFIQFDYFGEVGTFKIDSPPANVQSLTFGRKNSDSDGVIKVTGTLLDIKNMKAKVTLRGLAFQLMPNAVLISGSDGSKPNGGLVIDSCFIFADTLDNTFISWLADNAASVEIRNSYIVVGESKNALARIALTAGSVLFNNNLINYSGRISATGISKEFQFLSNTVNRTQFELTGVVDVTQPRLEFAKNLFAHHGAKDAFNAAGFFVLYYGLFDTSRVAINGNKMYSTWNGFDSPSGARFKPVLNNVIIDTIPGKSSHEMWNWYTETLDANQTGLLSGGTKREKYNVMPSVSMYGWSLPSRNLSVEFQPALYPRMIVLDTPNTKLAQPPDSAFHRRVFPSAGYAHFGPFHIKSITLGSAAVYGKPVLLAADSLDSLRTQANTAPVNANPSLYTNNLAKARKFVLVNAGNTPKGNEIRIGLGEGSTVKAADKLVIAKVDSSGESTVNSVFAGPGALTTELRSLGVGYLVKSTAVAASLFQAGAKEEILPYSPDKVYWLFRNGSDTLVPAVKGLNAADSGRYTAAAKYSTAKGDLSAYLVEKLSIPAGGKSIALADGSVKVKSSGGFQLTVLDTGYVADRELYGTPTKAYAFTWPVKPTGDSIEITLKADSSQVLFVRLANGIVDSVANIRRTDTTLSYWVLEADKGKYFFAAMPYNIQKGKFYDNMTYDGVKVTGFRSSSSGKLVFEGLSSDFEKSLGAAVMDFRLLGGVQMKAVSMTTLNPDIAYKLEFLPSKSPLNVNMVQAYAYNGTAWSIVQAVPVVEIPLQGKYLMSQVPSDTKAIAIVERLEAAETYVTDSTEVKGTNLSVSTKYVNDSINHITHYCVELQWVNEAGKVDSEFCQVKNRVAIGQVTEKTLLSNNAYQIRILYYIGDEEIKGTKFGLLRGTSLSAMAAAASDDVKIKPARIWHLVGFPVRGGFPKFMHRSDSTEKKSELDQTLVMRFRKHNQGDTSKAVFDTIPKWDSITVKPGDAYLLASSRPFETRVAADDSALELKPYTMPLDTGWILVSNPFCARQVRSKIISSGTNDRLFYRLDFQTKPDGKRTYSWTTDSVLRPFFGYAYYAKKNESLTFNPLMGAAAKTGQGTAQTGDFEARLDAPWGLSAMTLTASPGRSNVPFLPVPGPGLQLRVGGGNGYMVKTLSSADQIDEPVEIISPASGRGAFTFSSLFRTGMVVRLLDVETGAVHDEAGARDLPITEGSHAFRLIAGDEAFVQARVQAFQAAAPAEISMSQNYPNPFRGRTNVELRWPAWQGGARKAVLDVIDMRGRLLRRVDLGEVRMGRQVVTLDSKDWLTGVYLYRLTVVAGGRRVQMQKRMLVTP